MVTKKILKKKIKAKKPRKKVRCRDVPPCVEQYRGKRQKVAKDLKPQAPQ